jgi:hypothetical protein
MLTLAGIDPEFIHFSNVNVGLFISCSNLQTLFAASIKLPISAAE